MATSTSSNIDDVEYELVEAHELPVVDVSRSLEKALFSRAGLKTYKKISKRIDGVCMLLYTVAFPIGASVLTVATEYARVLAIFKFVFQVPTLTMTSSELRLDLLRCLVATYEFWFFTVMNFATCIMFAMHLGDLRMFLTPVYWYGIQVTIWADAKVQGPQLASAAALAAVYHIFLLVVFAMQLTPDPHVRELVRHAGHSMTSTDFLMNSFSTMMVLMMRTAFRKRALHRRSDDDPRVLRFVSYRCRVRFQRIDRTAVSAIDLSPPLPPPSSDTLLPSAALAPLNDSGAAALAASQDQSRLASVIGPLRPTAQRLQYVRPRTTFHSNRVVAPRVARFITTHSRWRVPLLYAVGALGFSIHISAYVCTRFALLTPSTGSTESFVVLSLLGIASTFGFVGAFAACYQRQLVRKLLRSFDFLFLSLQITLGYVSVGVVLDWDVRCCALPIAWLWLHWVLMLDALTPTVKAALRFRNGFAKPVLVLAVVIQIVSSMHILSLATDAVYARVLVRFTIYGRTVAIRAVPFFLSRGVTIVLWLVRILWRLLRNHDDDLTMIQGSVEFFGNPKALRRLTVVAVTGRSTTPCSLARQVSAALLSARARIHPSQS